MPWNVPTVNPRVPCALAHLGGGLVGEGDGGDLLGLQPGLQQARDLVHDDTRLARAGAGEHEVMSGRRADRLALGGVQIVEQVRYVHRAIVIVARNAQALISVWRRWHSTAA